MSVNISENGGKNMSVNISENELKNQIEYMKPILNERQYRLFPINEHFNNGIDKMYKSDLAG